MTKKWSRLPSTMKDFKKRLKIDKEQIELDCPNGNAMMVSNPLKYPFFTFFRKNTWINVQTINSNPKSKYWSQRWTRKNERGIFNFWSRCVDIEIFSSSKRMKKNARTTKDYVNSKNMNVRHKNWVKSVKQTSSQYKIYQKIHRKFIFFNSMEVNFWFSELKQIQNEKRRLLVETETEKLKSLDESFKKKFEHWRDKLGPRKQVSPVTIYFSKHFFECLFWIIWWGFLWKWVFSKIFHWYRRHRGNPKSDLFTTQRQKDNKLNLLIFLFQELEEQFSKQMLEWEQFFSQQDLPQTPSGSKRLSNFYRIS